MTRNFISRKFYYWRMRKYIKFIEKMTRRLTKDQEKGFGIIRSLASKSDSEILMTPLSEKFYIHYGDIYVIVERDNVSIINGVYHYDIELSDDAYSKVKSYLYRVIERRRSHLETDIRSRIDKSLEFIFQEVKNLKEPKKDKQQ